MSNLSLGEGAGWRAPRLPGHLLARLGTPEMLARAGSSPAPFFLNTRPGTFEFRGWEGQGGLFIYFSSWDCGIDGKGRGGNPRGLWGLLR